MPASITQTCLPKVITMTRTSTAGTTGSTSTRGTARQRLLDAATELFYAEGVHTVGIDRVIERAGVAKASLYNTFGSKDELVHAYLQGRHAAAVERIAKATEGLESPRDRLAAIFDAQGQLFSRPGFRGCAFASASAEEQPGGLVEEATNAYRAWFRGVFTDIARDGGAADPEQLGRQLQQLHDGASASARLDRDGDREPAADIARVAALALYDAATA
jgi:AcrR family transcriptional regulator